MKNYEGSITWMCDGHLTRERVRAARYNAAACVLCIEIVGEDSESYEVAFRGPGGGAWTGRGAVAGWSIECDVTAFVEREGALHTEGTFRERYEPNEAYAGSFECDLDADET